MTVLKSSSSAIRGTLRQAFETDFCGMCAWDTVRIIERNELVRVIFRVGNDQYTISAHPPEEKPPLGLLRLVGAGDEVSGPIDPATFARFAHAIRTCTPSTTPGALWD